MPELAKILLPVDFSERSQGAVRYGKALAAHFHSELTLLHVLAPPHYEFGALEVGGSMLTELYANRSAQVEKELAAFLASELRDIKVRRIVLTGDPASRIVEYAHEQGINLIVMPTHGYGPFRRFILGSNTAKVLHDADCPVWTGVHLEEAATKETICFERILCAVDLGPQSGHTLEWAAFFQRACNARLTLMHVSAAPGQGDFRSQIDQEMQKLKDQAGAESDVQIECGDPAKTVCAAAAHMKADLLVIGRGSARGVFGRLRTNAYAIIRESPCPVVSV
jgi:nucleotide-binding universal stress UspA family protein